MVRLLIALSFCFSTLPGVAHAAAEGVAKVIILKGSAFAVGPDKKKVEVTKNSWLKEGTVIQTEAKSFAKLLFIDKSQMNLGPSSEMVISEFPENKAGIITLMKGELRSQVTKNYMDMDKDEKSKLYIKTKTAAMGVRGTEFHVSFNPENLKTALVTLSGEVSFVQVNNEILANSIDRAVLERAVSSSDAVSVTKGQFSGAGPDLPRATLPVSISPAQFEVIKNNDGTKASAEGEDQVSAPAPKKGFRNVVPPGMNAKAVANEGTGMEKALKSTAGSATMAKAQAVVTQNSAAKVDTKAPPPEGYVNGKTGAIAPTAGGFIDMKTAQYIPPPKGSSFDPATKTYTPPASMGTFDPSTGAYKNDSFTLTSKGEFVAKAEIASTTQTNGTSTATRAPASTTSATTTTTTNKTDLSTPPPTLTLIPQVEGVKVDGDLANITVLTNTNNDVKTTSNTTGGTPTTTSAGTGDTQIATASTDDFDTDALIEETLENRDEDVEDILEEITEQATKTKVTFTVQ